MDAAGDYLLAGPALAGQQHGGVGGSDFARQFEKRGHFRIAGNHAAAIEAPGLLLAHQGMFEFGTPLVQRTADRHAEFIGAVEGFTEVVLGPQLHGFDGRFECAEGGDHDHGNVGRLFGEPAEYFDAAAVGQSQVGDHEVVLPDRTESHGVGNGSSGFHLIPFIGEDGRQQFPKTGVVVNY